MKRKEPPVGVRLDTVPLVLPPDVAGRFSDRGRAMRAPGRFYRLLERFEEKLTVIPDGCWLWHGPIDKLSGVAGIGIGGKGYGAHRIAYRIFIGPIPANMDVIHTCANKHCVKPHHLRLGDANLESLAKYGPPKYRVSAADLALIEARDAPQQP
jgi:HNH endonuclease